MCMPYNCFSFFLFIPLSWNTEESFASPVFCLWEKRRELIPHAGLLLLGLAGAGHVVAVASVMQEAPARQGKVPRSLLRDSRAWLQKSLSHGFRVHKIRASPARSLQNWKERWDLGVLILHLLPTKPCCENDCKEPEESASEDIMRAETGARHSFASESGSSSLQFKGLVKANKPG